MAPTAVAARGAEKSLAFDERRVRVRLMQGGAACTFARRVSLASWELMPHQLSRLRIQKVRFDLEAFAFSRLRDESGSELFGDRNEDLVPEDDGCGGERSTSRLSRNDLSSLQVVIETEFPRVVLKHE